MSNSLTVKVALEVAHHEALIRQTYMDSVGVPTWCIGMTAATGHEVERYWDKPQNLQKCMDVYVWALDNYANTVRQVFKDHDLTEAQFAAALSFHWNTGAIKRASWVKHWKKGDMPAARQAFMLWTKPKSITARRHAECRLLFEGKWSNKGTTTEFTRLTSRRTPVWGSARTIDISKQMGAAIAKHGGADQGFQPEEEEVVPARTITAGAGLTPKREVESTTQWSAVGGLVTTTVGALSGIDWRIAVPLIIVAAAFAFWIIRERRKKREEHGI